MLYFQDFKCLTWLNRDISVSSGHLNPLHRAVLRAEGIIPFYHVTKGGVSIALPEQGETSVHKNCPGHSLRFHIWKEENMYTAWKTAALDFQVRQVFYDCETKQTQTYYPFHYHIPVERRGITTLVGWESQSVFFATTVAMIMLPLLEAAICVRLTGAAVVSGEKMSVCCPFSIKRVTS